MVSREEVVAPSVQSISLDDELVTKEALEAEVIEEAQMDGVSQEQLVDLIDKPAWKTLLYSIVDREKMDPWDIDIVRLSNAYLGKIREMKEFNFALPANAVLTASIFLSFKAKKVSFDNFLPQPEPEFDSVDDDVLGFNGFDPSTGEHYVLEPEITAPPQRLPSRRVTLDELIEAVQGIMDHKKVEKITLRNDSVERALSNFKISKQDVQEQIQFTLERIERNKDSQGLVKFSDVIFDGATPEQKSSPLARIEGVITYLVPVLYLSAQRKVNVWQDDFFGEIFIQTLTEEEMEKGRKEVKENVVEEDDEDAYMEKRINRSKKLAQTKALKIVNDMPLSEEFDEEPITEEERTNAKAE